MKIISLDAFKKSIPTKRRPEAKAAEHDAVAGTVRTLGAPLAIVVSKGRGNIDEVRKMFAAAKAEDVEKISDTLTDGDTIATYTMSDDSVDRPGDVIKQEGWVLDEYRANPQFLFGHDSHEPPIGKALTTFVEGNRLRGTFKFMSAEISAFAAMIGKMVVGDKSGSYLPAGSVGFKPIEFEVAEERMDPNDEMSWWMPPLNFLKQLLLEFSAVPLPANPNALVDGAKGLLPFLSGEDAKLLRSWAERMVEGQGGLVIPRALAEKMASSGAKHFLVQRNETGDVVEGEPFADEGCCPSCGTRAALTEFRLVADEEPASAPVPVEDAPTKALVAELRRRGVSVGAAPIVAPAPAPAAVAPEKKQAPVPTLPKESEDVQDAFESKEALADFVAKATKDAVAAALTQRTGRLPD